MRFISALMGVTMLFIYELQASDKGSGKWEDVETFTGNLGSPVNMFPQLQVQNVTDGDTAGSLPLAPPVSDDEGVKVLDTSTVIGWLEIEAIKRGELDEHSTSDSGKFWEGLHERYPGLYFKRMAADMMESLQDLDQKIKEQREHQLAAAGNLEVIKKKITAKEEEKKNSYRRYSQMVRAVYDKKTTQSSFEDYISGTSGHNKQKWKVEIQGVKDDLISGFSKEKVDIKQRLISYPEDNSAFADMKKKDEDRHTEIVQIENFLQLGPAQIMLNQRSLDEKIDQLKKEEQKLTKKLQNSNDLVDRFEKGMNLALDPFQPSRSEYPFWGNPAVLLSAFAELECTITANQARWFYPMLALSCPLVYETFVQHNPWSEMEESVNGVEVLLKDRQRKSKEALGQFALLMSGYIDKSRYEQENQTSSTAPWIEEFFAEELNTLRSDQGLEAVIKSHFGKNTHIISGSIFNKSLFFNKEMQDKFKDAGLGMDLVGDLSTMEMLQLSLTVNRHKLHPMAEPLIDSEAYLGIVRSETETDVIRKKQQQFLAEGFLTIYGLHVQEVILKHFLDHMQSAKQDDFD